MPTCDAPHLGILKSWKREFTPRKPAVSQPAKGRHRNLIGNDSPRTIGGIGFMAHCRKSKPALMVA